MSAKRAADEPAYVLHRYDWSESSLILEAFTRGQGRVALVAKGAKRPSSSLRPVLLPLQPLRLAFGGDAEIRTLRAAEWVGGHVMPTGDALLSGYYINELLMRLLARDDPHPALFDAYASAVAVLATQPEALLHTALRAFELLLLREIGLLPQLDAQTLALAPLEPEARYCLVPEGGLRIAHAGETTALPGRVWPQLQAALDDAAAFNALLHACAPVALPLRSQLRTLLQYHCGGHPLRTRTLMRELQGLAASP